MIGVGQLRELRVCAVSDLHGMLPDTPACDLLLIAGDLTWHPSPEAERAWMNGPFRRWLEDRDADCIIGVAGNHDFYAEQNPAFMRSLPWVYLSDETHRYAGHVIHGSPWSNWFGDWAFMGDERELASRADLIPDDTTILVTHGPPNGIGDYVLRGEHVGANAFSERALSLPNLKLHVFGHIHEARGEWRQNGTTFANVSHVDLRYEPHDRPPFAVLLSRLDSHNGDTQGGLPG